MPATAMTFARLRQSVTSRHAPAAELTPPVAVLFERTRHIVDGMIVFYILMMALLWLNCASSPRRKGTISKLGRLLCSGFCLAGCATEAEQLLASSTALGLLLACACLRLSSRRRIGTIASHVRSCGGLRR